MKNIKFILIFTLIFTLSIGPGFAADDIKVTIDGSEISFDTEPERSGRTIMVPMKEFFEAMGARILWVESQRMVVAYKDNTHMKLQLGSDLAYRNGNKLTLEAEPYISGGHTLVPIQIIAETFNMKPNWDGDANTLKLEGSEADAGLKLFDDGIYKTKPINELGITISIPYHWKNLDGPFQYGHQDDFESYSITLMSQSIDKDIELEDLVNENKALLLDAYDENITFTGEESIKIDNILDVKKLYITTTLNEKKQKQVLYILKQDDKAYFMTCHYGEEVPEDDIIEVFDNVISTFKIRNLSVDTEEEHYMEFEDYYYNGVKLNQEFYSNMVVEKSEIPFSGTLEEGHELDAFKVTVTSDRERLDFIIPITGNAFDGTVYTPFGLGKHNIFVSGIPTEAALEKKSSTNLANESSEPKTDSESEQNVEPSNDQSNTTDSEPNNVEPNNSESTNTDTPEANENDLAPTTEQSPDDTLENMSEESTANDSSTIDTIDSIDTVDTNATSTEDSTSNSTEASIEVSIEASNENSQETTDTIQEANTDATSDGTETNDSKDINSVDDMIEDSSEVSQIIESSNITEIPLMQFSVINIDSRTMRFRIPTSIINSTDVQINSTSMLITYQVSNEYMKAKSLYNWMLNNIEIDSEGTIERSNIQVFDDAVGTTEQVNQLYVAFLRAIDIPARVMKGTVGDESYFWTELYLNGSWVASDLIEGIHIKDDDAIQHAQSTLFNINMEVVRDKFDFNKIMPY